MSHFIVSLRALAVFTLLTGIAYPLLICAAACLVPHLAGGSLRIRDGRLVGSRLLAQKTEDPAYFWYRPSAADYATVASGASNLSPDSAKLVEAIRERQARLGADAPAELLQTSGSGLDPHLTPAGARFQVERIVRARGLAPEAASGLSALIARLTEPRTFGLFGQPRVNVLDLNLALDETYPRQ